MLHNLGKTLLSVFRWKSLTWAICLCENHWPWTEKLFTGRNVEFNVDCHSLLKKYNRNFLCVIAWSLSTKRRLKVLFPGTTKYHKVPLARDAPLFQFLSFWCCLQINGSACSLYSNLFQGFICTTGKRSVGYGNVFTRALADLHSKILDARPPPPPGRQNSFNFMRYLGEFGKIVCSFPLLKGSCPHLVEILDPPLKSMSLLYPFLARWGQVLGQGQHWLRLQLHPHELTSCDGAASSI